MVSGHRHTNVIGKRNTLQSHSQKVNHLIGVFTLIVSDDRHEVFCIQKHDVLRHDLFPIDKIITNLVHC